MYALKSEDYSTRNLAENSSPPYTLPLNDFGESNDQLADQITTLSGQINAATYRFLKLIAEFDRRQAWAGFGIRSCAHWLSWKCGIAMSAAREKVRTARALEGLPGINTAFQKGELSFSKVRAMTRVATDENESHFLNIAEYGTAQHMEVFVKAFRKVSRIADKAEDFNAAEVDENRKSILGESQHELRQQQSQQENRSVTCYQDDEGMWIIKAKLPAEEGGLIVKALSHLGDQLANTESNLSTKELDEKTNEKPPQKSAKGVSAETFSLNIQEEKLTFPQRRADAFVAIAEHYLASAETNSETNPQNLLSLKGAERCQLIMHIRAGSNHPEGTPTDVNLDDRWLIPNTARRLACDAGLLVVEEDEVGNVLNIGRRSRIIPPAMSRALTIRDGGCQFPGCCERRYVEGHHIKHWADGGETKLDNLVTLCRYHHRELHKGSFFLALKPLAAPLSTHKQPVRFAERLCFSKVEQYFNSPVSRFSNKDNKDQLIPVNPAKFTCACCDHTELANSLPSSLYNAIDAKTAVTKWAGESLDVSLAIDCLLSDGKKVTISNRRKH